MNSNLLHDRVVFLQLDTFGCILFVLGGNITAGAGQPAVFMLGAFHNYLNAVSFFSHLMMRLKLVVNLDFLSLGAQLFYNSCNAFLVDSTDGISRYLQGHPAVFFSQEETLGLQIGQEAALSLLVGK